MDNFRQYNSKTKSKILPHLFMTSRFSRNTGKRCVQQTKHPVFPSVEKVFQVVKEETHYRVFLLFHCNSALCQSRICTVPELCFSGKYF